MAGFTGWMMSDALKQFQSFLSAIFPDVVLNRNDVEPPALIIPAKNDETGALAIYDDGDEYTVAIGELHHTHFSAYNYEGDSKEQQMMAAAKDAAQHVVDILSDRICFVAHYRDDKCIGSTCCPVDEPDQVHDAVRDPGYWLSVSPTKSDRFTWSGRLG